jgi:hypothetical protein
VLSYTPEDEGLYDDAQSGELWLAEIPFASGMASKLQPVLVIWDDMADVVVAAVTKAGPRSPTDGSLHD